MKIERKIILDGLIRPTLLKIKDTEDKPFKILAKLAFEVDNIIQDYKQKVSILKNEEEFIEQDLRLHENSFHAEFEEAFRDKDVDKLDEIWYKGVDDELYARKRRISRSYNAYRTKLVILKKEFDGIKNYLKSDDNSIKQLINFYDVQRLEEPFNLNDPVLSEWKAEYHSDYRSDMPKEWFTKD